MHVSRLVCSNTVYLDMTTMQLYPFPTWQQRIDDMLPVCSYCHVSYQVC